MSHDQRNGGRGFRKEYQQSGQNSSYRDERAGTDSNETCVKTIHEEMRNVIEQLRSVMLPLECGCKLPVVADACQLHNERMPVCIGMMGGQSVSELRDTGRSTIVVKRELVDDEQMTGGTETCILIDGTVRRTPVAEIKIETPYYTSKVKAVCLESQLYEVIIGNVPGVSDEDNNRLKAQAVVTRAQAKQQFKPTKPLKVIENLEEDVTREKLITLQGQDPSLTKFMKEAEQNQKAGRAEVYFKMKDGILYRYCRNFEGREISQVVIPKELREMVMTMAYDAVMSGHQGQKKTKDRIWREFWWPGIGAEVTRFCRSCDICQRTIAKGRVPSVPLGKMPIIDTPFDRVAVD